MGCCGDFCDHLRSMASLCQWSGSSCDAGTCCKPYLGATDSHLSPSQANAALAGTSTKPFSLPCATGHRAVRSQGHLPKSKGEICCRQRSAAEAHFATPDSLSRSQRALIELTTNHWQYVSSNAAWILAAVERATPGSFQQVDFPDLSPTRRSLRRSAQF